VPVHEKGRRKHSTRVSNSSHVFKFTHPDRIGQHETVPQVLEALYTCEKVISFREVVSLIRLTQNFLLEFREQVSVIERTRTSSGKRPS